MMRFCSVRCRVASHRASHQGHKTMTKLKNKRQKVKRGMVRPDTGPKFRSLLSDRGSQQ